MTKFFTVSTDPLTVEQESAFRAKISGAGYWHWLPNHWLIKDSAEAFTPTMLTTWLKEINPYARALALQVRDTEWSVLMKPDPKLGAMDTWLRETWDKKPG